MIEFEDHFEAVFIGVTSQAVKTEDDGQPVGHETRGDVLKE